MSTAISMLPNTITIKKEILGFLEGKIPFFIFMECTLCGHFYAYSRNGRSLQYSINPELTECTCDTHKRFKARMEGDIKIYFSLSQTEPWMRILKIAGATCRQQ